MDTPNTSAHHLTTYALNGPWEVRCSCGHRVANLDGLPAAVAAVTAHRALPLPVPNSRRRHPLRV